MLRQFTKRPWLLVLLGTAVTLLVVAFTQWQAAIKRNRSQPDEPFRIAGNLYYVGHTGVTAFLLTGPAGHVLIDGGYPETAPLIIASIAKLGFNIRDVKVLLNTHAHNDHAGGLRELQQASGADLWVSEGDADVMVAGSNGADPALGRLRIVGMLFGAFPTPRIDHRFKDGAVVRLGPLALTAHVTAGHTRGCTSWSFPVRDGDRELLAVDICSLTLFPFVSLIDPEAYPGIRSDFERSFRTLRSLPADIFLASHSNMFSMQHKLRERAVARDPAQPFIDRDGYITFIDDAEHRFRQELEKQEEK
jgi:metallo-beta-lactamase class B